jgi:Transmembrane amino acid transporter protein
MTSFDHQSQSCAKTNPTPPRSYERNFSMIFENFGHPWTTIVCCCRHWAGVCSRLPLSIGATSRAYPSALCFVLHQRTYRYMLRQHKSICSPEASNYFFQTMEENHDHNNTAISNVATMAVQEQQQLHISRSTTTTTKTSTNTTGLVGTSANLINTIVGAGIIGIPFAVEQSGLVVGLLLLLLVSWMTAKSLRMIVELARNHPQLAGKGISTFEDLMKIPFGETGKTFMLISMFVFAYGAMVAYLIIIKDSVPTIIGYGDTIGQRNLVMLLTSLVFIVSG